MHGERCAKTISTVCIELMAIMLGKMVIVKGPHSRQRTRAFFRILSVYTIIMFDHDVVVIKVEAPIYGQSNSSLRLQVE